MNTIGNHFLYQVRGQISCRQIHPLPEKQELRCISTVMTTSHIQWGLSKFPYFCGDLWVLMGINGNLDEDKGLPIPINTQRFPFSVMRICERGLAPDPAGGGHMGGSAPAVCGPQLLDKYSVCDVIHHPYQYPGIAKIKDKGGFRKELGSSKSWKIWSRPSQVPQYDGLGDRACRNLLNSHQNWLVVWCQGKSFSLWEYRRVTW